MFPKRSLENILFLLCFLLRSSVSDGSPSCNRTVYYYYYYYYYYFPSVFSEMVLVDFLEIFRNDALHQYLGKFFQFVKNSLPVGKYGRFSVFKKSFCPDVFSETVKDRVTKFSGMVDLSIGVCTWVCGCRPSLPVQTGSDKRNRKFQI